VYVEGLQPLQEFQGVKPYFSIVCEYNQHGVKHYQDPTIETLTQSLQQSQDVLILSSKNEPPCKISTQRYSLSIKGE